MRALSSMKTYMLVSCVEIAFSWMKKSDAKSLRVHSTKIQGRPLQKKNKDVSLYHTALTCYSMLWASIMEEEEAHNECLCRYRKSV